MTKKQKLWYEELKKFYYQSGRRIAKKYLRYLKNATKTISKH